VRCLFLLGCVVCLSGLSINSDSERLTCRPVNPLLSTLRQLGSLHYQQQGQQGLKRSPVTFRTTLAWQAARPLEAGSLTCSSAQESLLKLQLQHAVLLLRSLRL
jgi:5-enolpyruvylshikimate-3-phosphate synthase